MEPRTHVSRGRGQSPAQLIKGEVRAQGKGKGWDPGHWHWGQEVSSGLGRSAHLAPMAFLVSGTLQVAAQMADAQDSLGRKVVGGTSRPSPLLASS